MSASTILADVFREAVVRGADAGANYLVTHEGQIANELRSVADRGVDALAGEIRAALPTQSIGERAIHGEVDSTIANLAANVVAKINAAAPQLVDAAETELENVSSAAARGDR